VERRAETRWTEARSAAPTRWTEANSKLLPEADLSKWNTKSCENMSYMFAKTAIVDSGIGRWNVSAAKTDYMLQGTRFSGNLENWPAKQRADAVNGVLSRFGATSRLTRFGTAELLDLRSVFADLARAKSAQRAESAEGEERSSEGARSCEPFGSSVSFASNVSGWRLQLFSVLNGRNRRKRQKASAFFAFSLFAFFGFLCKNGLGRARVAARASRVRCTRARATERRRARAA
jgi:hypothetical protein